MVDDLIRAHLNLHAVLQNLEDLVKLDDEMADLTKDWDVSVQFSVRGGPAAYVAFRNGACSVGRGRGVNPSVKLYFTSPKHLNRMFDAKANPIPLKGFTRLGFMKTEFSRLTDRLAYYLKPAKEHLGDDHYRRVSTTLMLYTAVHAVRELVVLDPTCRQIAARIPPGTLQFEVLPDGPYAHIVFGKGNMTVGKTAADLPMARMTLKNLQVAGDLLGGRLDAFMAVADGDVMLHGQLPMIDNTSLILDRVAVYLS